MKTAARTAAVIAGALAATALATAPVQAVGTHDRGHMSNHSNAGMDRMHELHMQGNPGMGGMHQARMANGHCSKHMSGTQ